MLAGRSGRNSSKERSKMRAPNGRWGEKSPPLTEVAEGGRKRGRERTRSERRCAGAAEASEPTNNADPLADDWRKFIERKIKNAQPRRQVGRKVAAAGESRGGGSADERGRGARGVALALRRLASR